MQQKKLIVPILFLHYEESLVSSNFNSKQLCFLGVSPNVDGKNLARNGRKTVIYESQI